MSPLFAAFPADIAADLDDRAELLLTAVTTIVDFARPIDVDVDPARFDAVTLRALTIALSGAIAHPLQDEEQHQIILDMVVADLRCELGLPPADVRAAGML